MDEGTQEFGSLLRSRRRTSGLSQLELAERSGLSTRAISKLECGRTRWPYPDSVGRLADALGLRDTERAQFTAAARRRLALRAIPAQRRADPGYTPRLLPAPIPALTGRTGETATLSRLLHAPDGTTLVTTITGTAGTGKTALAVNWAHHAAARFPDGQLFLNLHGHGPTDNPTPPAQAARVLLDALRVPPDRLPATPEAQLGLLRSLLAGKRMLIILDNARNAAQVRPLLPAGPGCRVIVTSRDRLAGLTVTDGARPLTLNTLTDTDAHHLLATRLGPTRLATDQTATKTIITACAGLPLALCIIATRAELRPDLPLAHLAKDLTTTPPLDAFTDTTDPAADLRTTFSWSYRQLDTDATHTFHLAGLHPDLTLEPHTIATLTGTTPHHASHTLDTLARANLIHTTDQERYTMNPLLRAYAHEQATRHPDETRPHTTTTT